MRLSRRALLAAPFVAPAIRGARAQAVFTDDAGRAVQVPARVATVLAAGRPATPLLFALAPEKLAGWFTRLSPAEKPFLAPRWAELPVTGPLIDAAGNVAREAVARIAPQLIVDYGSLAERYVRAADRVQAATGVPVILLDGRLQALPRTLRHLGALLEAPAASQLAGDAEGRLARIDQILAGVPPQRRTRAYRARDADGLRPGVPADSAEEAILRAGGANVAAGMPLDAGGRASLAVVAAADPEVIVTTDQAAFAAIAARAEWQDMRARRTGRVHLVPPGPFGWINSPLGSNRLVGVEWLARIFYPDRFGDDFAASAAGFFAAHWHRAPDAQQLAAITASLDRLPPPG